MTQKKIQNVIPSLKEYKQTSKEFVTLLRILALPACYKVVLMKRRIKYVLCLMIQNLTTGQALNNPQSIKSD